MLTRPFLKNLATKAQQLRPVILIGAKGLTEPVHQEIDLALTAHQLVKIRINARSADQRALMVEEIATRQQATVVQTIGHVVVIYRAPSL